MNHRWLYFALSVALECCVCASIIPTFDVAAVERGNTMFPRTTVRESAATKIPYPIECVHSNLDLISPPSEVTNAFVATILTAYNQHYPLVLSPDEVWLTIAQGLATHIRENSEEMRSKFVDHQGKKKLEVWGDKYGISRGAPDNDWGAVLHEFATLVDEQVKDEILSFVTPTFTTTGEVEKVAAQITLLDALQNYFEYTVYLMCGIPRVTLLGTPDDWNMIVERVKRLQEYGLDWWQQELLPVVTKIAESANGNPDRTWWNTIADVIPFGSGSACVSGWIGAFFPYMKDGQRSTYWSHQMVDLVNFPSGLSSVPFILNDNGYEVDMRFVSGFLGVHQDIETLAVRPAIGWAACKNEIIKLQIPWPLYLAETNDTTPVEFRTLHPSA